MQKKIVALMISMFLLLTFGASVTAVNDTINIPDIDHMIYATIGEPDTVDPAKAYDSASLALIRQVYSLLLFFDYERLDQYLPHVAESWSIPDPQTYKFYIRSGVKFHNTTFGTITNEDVEYSIERAMVQDFTGGPTWMFYEPLTQYFNSKQFAGASWNLTKANILGHLIDDAIVSGTDGGGDYVQFNLAMAYAPFAQILSQGWAAILSYDWATEQGAWPGSGVAFGSRWGNYDTDWLAFNQRYNATVAVSFDNGGGSPGNHVMMGSGPYEFDDWTVGTSWSITKFTDYWEGWSPGPKSTSRVTMKLVENWAARKLLFLAGDVDYASVPTQFIAQVEGQPGIRGVKDLPLLVLSPGLHYNYAVNDASVYFGDMPELGGSQKLDLLSDIHMRKAISHTLDFATFISAAYLGEAEQPATPVIKGLILNWEELGKTPWAYNLALAKDEFKLAFGGTLESPGPAWTDGFHLPITYNSGNTARQMASEMIATAITTLITGWGTTPTVSTTGLSWGTAFIPGFLAKELPIFLIGWGADYADPHNFVGPYMHPEGDFTYFQTVSYGQSGWMQKETLNDPLSPTTVAVPFGDNSLTIDNDYMANLLLLGIEKTDYAERRAIYNEIQDIWLREYVGIAITQPLVRRWERDWVQGWYFNALLAAVSQRWMWKGLDADITGDDFVDIGDAGKISAHWHSATVDGPLGYDRYADIYPVSEMDASDFLLEGADGFVDIFDASMINAGWHDEAVGV